VEDVLSRWYRIRYWRMKSISFNLFQKRSRQSRLHHSSAIGILAMHAVAGRNLSCETHTHSRVGLPLAILHTHFLAGLVMEGREDGR
jgi:hypothetical protein